MSNRTHETAPHARDAFIEALERGMTISGAARLANLGRSTVYALRASDEGFARAWDDALETGTDALEDEAFRRAHDGVAEPLVSGGRQVLDAEGMPIVLRRYSRAQHDHAAHSAGWGPAASSVADSLTPSAPRILRMVLSFGSPSGASAL